MARETHPSICRFCHANCGILVEVEDGRPVRVTGDPENPAYFGFTCAKGRRLPEQHAHPERLLRSQKRGPDGRFAPIPSEQAMDEIAARLGEIVSKHGPRSVALYPGTYSGPHPASIPAGVGFMLGLGSKMVFTSAADRPARQARRERDPRPLARWLPRLRRVRRLDARRQQSADLDVGRHPALEPEPPAAPTRRRAG
jgi:anaerobic selenocysteine-containing dehydrogenase